MQRNVKREVEAALNSDERLWTVREVFAAMLLRHGKAVHEKIEEFVNAYLLADDSPVQNDLPSLSDTGSVLFSNDSTSDCLKFEWNLPNEAAVLVKVTSSEVTAEEIFPEPDEDPEIYRDRMDMRADEFFLIITWPLTEQEIQERGLG